jgi:hypothetical protein
MPLPGRVAASVVPGPPRPRGLRPHRTLAETGDCAETG